MTRDEQHAATMIEGVNSTARLLGIDKPDYTVSGPKDPDREYISEADALECLRLVREHLRDDNGPRLYRDHEGPYWNISYEGDYDWTIRIGDSGVAFPEGVFVEPVTGWCLGLYPA